MRSLMENAAPVVLVVEDEEALRRLAVRVLERAGFGVRVAATAEEALAIFGGSGQIPDVLISDIVLPGFNGIELARRLRERHPGLKVLLVSGYGDRREVRIAESEATPATAYLAKPFTSAAVVEAVRRLLSGRR